MSGSATTLLPDLAEELQRLEVSQPTAACPRLEGASPAIDEDLLTFDLIQWLCNKEMRNDPPAAPDIMVNPPAGKKSKMEQPRYTHQEKGKGIESPNAQRQRQQGRESTQASSMMLHREQGSKLLHREASSSKADECIHTAE